MKKLLSLLSVLTISGTAVPTIVAVSHYQKEEQKEIENINKKEINIFKIKLKQKVVITTNNYVFSSGVVLNNKLYFGSKDYNVYEYDPTTEQQKVVITTNDNVDSSGVV